MHRPSPGRTRFQSRRPLRPPPRWHRSPYRPGRRRGSPTARSHSAGRKAGSARRARTATAPGSHRRRPGSDGSAARHRRARSRPCRDGASPRRRGRSRYRRRPSRATQLGRPAATSGRATPTSISMPFCQVSRLTTENTGPAPSSMSKALAASARFVGGPLARCCCGGVVATGSAGRSSGPRRRCRCR